MDDATLLWQHYQLDSMEDGCFKQLDDILAAFYSGMPATLQQRKQYYKVFEQVTEIQASRLALKKSEPAFWRQHTMTADAYQRWNSNLLERIKRRNSFQAHYQEFREYEPDYQDISQYYPILTFEKKDAALLEYDETLRQFNYLQGRDSDPMPIPLLDGQASSQANDVSQKPTQPTDPGPCSTGSGENAGAQALSSAECSEQHPPGAGMRKVWTPTHAAYLEALKRKYPGMTNKDLADRMTRKFHAEFTASQVQQRWYRVQDPKLLKGRWSDAETAALRELFDKHAGNQRAIHEEMPSRSLLQIQRRLRTLGLLL